MSKIPLIVPTKNSRNHVVLGRRGNVLQWFTQPGWDGIPDELNNVNGKRTRIPKGGWVKVSPDDFEAPPAPLTGEAVVKTPPAGSKEVKTTEGADVTEGAGTKEAPTAEEKLDALIAKAEEKADTKADKASPPKK